MINSDGARKLVLATPIPAAELAIRIVEAYHGLKRPDSQTADDCFAALTDRDRQGALAAASAALAFFGECISSNAATVQ